MSKKGVLFLVLSISMLIVSCEKEGESDAPYVGSWETVVYDAIDPTTQVAIKQKVDFEFENKSFEAQISNGVTEDALATALGVRGDIEDKGEQVISVEIMELGIAVSGAIAWSSKSSTDAAEITTYNTLMSMVGTMLPETFDANYVVDGDNMDLIIPSVQDTIHLYKK